jgi:CBS domain-containing protein
MMASEIVTRAVAAVHTGSSVRHAAELLTERGVTFLPVLDDDDRVVGIVIEVDLIRKSDAARPPKPSASGDVRTTRPRATRA